MGGDTHKNCGYRPGLVAGRQAIEAKEGQPGEYSMVRGKTSGKEHGAAGVARAADGLTALEDFLQALFAIGYLKRTPDGTKPRVGIEAKPMPGETSEAVLAGTKRARIEARTSAAARAGAGYLPTIPEAVWLRHACQGAALDTGLVNPVVAQAWRPVSLTASHPNRTRTHPPDTRTPHPTPPAAPSPG